MRVLFATTVCCFVALLWAALALARRIRMAQLLGMRPAQRPSAYTKQEFFEAGEFRTPRPLRLEQEILQDRSRRSLSEIFFTTERPASPVSSTAVTHEESRSPEPIPIRPGTFASLFGQTVSIARIDSDLVSRTAEILAPHTETGTQNVTPLSLPVSLPTQFTLHRRQPQGARPSGIRRVDLSQYNKDMGDLTDPYTLRASGTQGPSPTSRNNRY